MMAKYAIVQRNKTVSSTYCKAIVTINADSEEDAILQFNEKIEEWLSEDDNYEHLDANAIHEMDKVLRRSDHDEYYDPIIKAYTVPGFYYIGDNNPCELIKADEHKDMKSFRYGENLYTLE